MSRQDSWSRVPYRTRQHIKQLLLARDGLTCCVCGTRIATARAATVEHKRERSAGGSVLDLRNLGLAHAACNYGRRGSRLGRVPTVAGVSFFEVSERRNSPRSPVPSPGLPEEPGGDQR